MFGTHIMLAFLVNQHWTSFILLLVWTLLLYAWVISKSTSVLEQEKKKKKTRVPQLLVSWQFFCLVCSIIGELQNRLNLFQFWFAQKLRRLDIPKMKLCVISPLFSWSVFERRITEPRKNKIRDISFVWLPWGITYRNTKTRTTNDPWLEESLGK